MYQSVKQMLDKSRAIWDQHPGFNSNVERFTILYEEVLKISNEIATSVRPVTERKHENLEKLADQAIILQGVLISFARKTENADLERKASMTESAFRRGAVMNRIISAKILQELSQDPGVELDEFGWTKEDMENYRSLITLAEEEMTAPKSEISNRAVKRESLEEKIREIDSTLELMDKLILAFQEAQEFLGQWERSRNIIDYPGKRRSIDASMEAEEFDDPEDFSGDSPPEDESDPDNS
jgi:hypothetical protein